MLNVGEENSNQSGAAAMANLVAKIPFGSTGTVPAVPRKPVAVHAVTSETLPPPELFALVTENCRKTAITVCLERGHISEDIRNPKGNIGNDRFWISLDPSNMVRSRNRITCTLELEGRKFCFEAGVMTQPWSNGASSYFVDLRKQSDAWIEFGVVGHKFIPHSGKSTNKDQGEGDEEDHVDEEEEIESRKRDRDEDLRARQIDTSKKGKEEATDFIVLDTPSRVSQFLREGDIISLGSSEKSIPNDRRRSDNPTLWLCVDYGRSSVIRTFEFSRDDQSYRFSAAVDIQRRNGHFHFIRIKNFGGWETFEVISIANRVQGGDDDDGQSGKKGSGKKRERTGDVADVEKARHVFDALYGDNDDPAIFDTFKLEIVDGDIRDPIRKNSNRCWLVLDYGGNHKHPEDVITFKASSNSVEVIFKALVCVNRNNASRHGMMMVHVVGDPLDQYKTFGILEMKDMNDDHRTKNDAEIIEDGGYVELIQIDVSKDSPSKRQKPEAVVEPPINNEWQPIQSAIAQFAEVRANKVKAEAEVEMTALKETIKLMEVKLMKAIAQKQTMLDEYGLLQGEIDVLKSGRAHAENEKAQAERKLAALERSIKEKPSATETIGVPVAEHQKTVQDLADLKIKHADLDRELRNLILHGQSTTLMLKTRAAEARAESLMTELYKKEEELVAAQQTIQNLESIKAVSSSSEIALTKDTAIAALNSLLLEDAYKEIIQQSPNIRAMIEAGLRQAIADEKAEVDL